LFFDKKVSDGSKEIDLKESNINKEKNIQKRRGEVEHLEESQYNVWTLSYQPKYSGEVLGNSAEIDFLVSYLTRWKKKVLQEVDCGVKVRKNEDEYVLSGEDSEDECKDNVLVIHGSCGVGKTSTVHACANQLGFQVLELNASDLREGKRVMEYLKEATLSHNIRNSDKAQKKKASQKNIFFTKYSKTTALKPAAPNKNKKLSLVLFDEVEAVLPQDKGFWAAVKWFMDCSKTPVVLTTNHLSVIPNDISLLNYQRIHLNHPSKIDLMKKVDEFVIMQYSQKFKKRKKSNLNVSKSFNVEDIITCSRSQYDARNFITTAYFWLCNNLTYSRHHLEKIPSIKLTSITSSSQFCECLHEMMSIKEFTISKLKNKTKKRRRKTVATEKFVVAQNLLLLHLSDTMQHYRHERGFYFTSPYDQSDKNIETNDLMKMFDMNSYLDNYLWQINKYQKLPSYCNNTVNFFEGVEDKHETEELKWESYNLSAEIRASMQYFFVGNMNKATNFSISFQNSCFSNKIFEVSSDDGSKSKTLNLRSYHTEVIPILKNICDLEDKRKSLKRHRRFRHCLLSSMSSLEIARISSLKKLV